MALRQGDHQEHEIMSCSSNSNSRVVHYPLDANCYKLVDEIGVGVSATVYKAICVPADAVVAIKAIDLDKSRANFDDVRREAKTMSLLSHPNILRAHCSFTVDRRLWVVMPFMAGGSLQSIMSTCFSDGMSEPCIAVVLKDTLNALSYLHNQGHLHRDIKAGNILIDSNGTVMLADFGVSASIYESNSNSTTQSGWSSSSSMLTDFAGTPYWMAPEVIHSHTGYSFKADIWSLGITALELAYGHPPLSHLSPTESLFMKITKQFRFSDYEKQSNKEHKDNKHNNNNNKKFSKAFKDMVASCLDQDPSKRPSAGKLLKHSFFKNCKGPKFLVKNVLHGLPSIKERFKQSKLRVKKSIIGIGGEEDEEEEEGPNIKERRISGWNFNEEGFELEPVLFPSDDQIQEESHDSVVKQVRFCGESIVIQETGAESGAKDESSMSTRDDGADQVDELGQVIGDTDDQHTEDGSSGDATSGVYTDELCVIENRGVVEQIQVQAQAQVMGLLEIGGGAGGFDREVMVRNLIRLRRSLDEQRQQANNLIGLLGGADHHDINIMWM